MCPDALPLLVAEVLVVQRDMDPAEECGVERLHPVGGEEEHAAVVFKCAEEDGHQAVAGNVAGGPVLQVDVRLVEEDERAVALAQREEVGQVLLHVVERAEQVAGCKGHEGPVGELGDAFCR